MKKAQMFSLDLIFASIIFIGIITILINSWTTASNKAYYSEQHRKLELSARSLSNLLLQTEGNPSNWTSTSIGSIGLALSTSQAGLNTTFKSRPAGLNKRGAWYLDSAKLNALQAMDYLQSKALMELSADEHYYMIVSQWNNSAYVPYYVLGMPPYANATNIIGIERFAMLNNKWARFEFRVWGE